MWLQTLPLFARAATAGGGAQQSTSKQQVGKKRKFTTYPGASRSELMQSKAGIIKPRDPVLWNVQALRATHVDFQDDAMEIFSPPRVAKKVHDMGFKCS
eukprot:8952516-Pyramimonas_sp.AAC.2